MFNAISGTSVVDCGFVIGEGKFSKLGIKFSVEWSSNTIMKVIRVAYVQIVYFQENNCIVDLFDIQINILYIYIYCKKKSKN